MVSWGPGTPFLTIEPDGTPRFPNMVGRWYFAQPTGGAVGAINEPVTEHVRAGQASAIRVTATQAGATVVVRWDSVEGATYRLESSPNATDWIALAGASAVTSSGGETTTFTTSTVAAQYRVTLTALATYDTRGTAGLSGIGNSATAAVGATGTARLVNIATRAALGGVAGTPVSGFVLGGAGTKPMLARATGPTLASFGVTGSLADPRLSLVSDTTVLAANDNWSSAANAGELAATATADVIAAAGNATPRAFIVPPGFPQPELPADNPLTVEGVALGERLFHDRRLSAGNLQSCTSCHREELAFADDRPLSASVSRQLGRRNSMPLFNLAWSPAYAWDGSMPRIRDQVRAAMINPIEMHADLATVTAALNHDDAVRAEFAAAFGTAEVSADRVFLALEQDLLTLVAADSKFDRARRGDAALTAEEQRGFELFSTEYDPVRGQRGADCFHCHGGVLFSDIGFRDNGLGQTSTDVGREGVTGRTTDRAKFKIPSLRNVAATAPYMHDGRFGTLEDVVAHYDHGLIRTANLDPNLAKHPDSGLQLSADDQRALVAFLRTLTDSKLLIAP